MNARIWFLSALAAFALACGGGNVDKKGSCESGESRSCTCEDGASGSQECTGSLDWGACVCEADDECGSDDDCADGETCNADGVCEEEMVADADGDGVADGDDNCPDDANPDQADEDGDGIGDACEVPGDDDGDGVLDAEDNCPQDANPEQDDLDQDNIGDPCDDDRDGDDVNNGVDNCPDVRNAAQTDTNGDGIGDACDGDFDGIVDSLDNCPDDQNADQADQDGDDIGDACDLERDGDGVLDADDNCPLDPNDDQLDTDSDGEGDVCDDDDDGDMRPDAEDNCPLVENRLQQDRNQNGVGDACDDPDGDGVVDADDNCPDEANPDQADVDSDGDGIQDCDERALGTDPNEADSDGDGLDDLEEVAVHGTDPTLSDTDSDGLSDAEELDFGLDPTNPSTFNDGVLDGDRDFVMGCLTPDTNPTTSYTNTDGDWQHVVPTDVSDTQLTVTGATTTNGWAATVLQTTGGDVAGFVIRQNQIVDPEDAEDWLKARVGADGRPRHFESPLGDHVVMSRNYEVTTTSKTLDEHRNELLDLAAWWPAGSISGLPTTGSNSATTVRGFLSITSTANDEVIVAGAVADADTLGDEQLELMEDLTNATALAPTGEMLDGGCGPWAPNPDDPALELYWVLDQSGSMTDDNTALQNEIGNVYSILNNGHVDFRMGVANMDEASMGHLSPVGWHTDRTMFENTVQSHVINCTGCGGSSGYAEYGIQNARDGITYFRDSMTPAADQARTDAEIVTVFISDEESQYFQDNSINTTAGQNQLSIYETFFESNSVVFSMTGDGSDCSLSDGEAYRSLARATSGADLNLCPVNAEKLSFVAYGAVGAASRYVLPRVPVSSSLKVLVDGVEVSRSRVDGYEYFPEFNSVAFFGPARPAATDSVIVHFESFAP